MGLVRCAQARLGNVASPRVHERRAFRVAGVYHRHGRFDGAWRDCVIVEKSLDEHP